MKSLENQKKRKIPLKFKIDWLNFIEISYLRSTRLNDSTKSYC